MEEFLQKNIIPGKTNLEIIKDQNTISVKQEIIYGYGIDGSDEEIHDEVYNENAVEELSMTEPEKPELPSEMTLESQLRILNNTESLENLDFDGYRLIWASLRDVDGRGLDSVNHRIRLQEESQPNRKCEVANTYFDRVITHIDTNKQRLDYREKDDIIMSHLIKKIYCDHVYIANKQKRNCDELLEFVRTIVGERCRESLLNILIYCIFKAVKSKRRSIFSKIKPLTLPFKLSEGTKKRFR